MAGTTPKKHSIQKLLRWALTHAIDDREHFLDCLRGTNPKLAEETRREIERFRAMLKAKQLKAEGDDMRLACVYAESERKALIASLGAPKPDDREYLEEQTQMFAQLHQLRMDTWGETFIEKFFRESKPVSVTELLKGK
jgi:hypothetical protein